MWNELEQYKNHFLQYEIKNLKSESINNVQEKALGKALFKRGKCANFPQVCSHSTYFDDRAQLAYGWFALPKLMREMNSHNSLTHWRAIKSLSEFLLNPLHAQRALQETEIVRKAQNAFMRYRLNIYKEEHSEVETLTQIFNILSRYLIGAEQIAKRKCLLNEFYMMLEQTEPHQWIAAEILRNLSWKPEVLAILFKGVDNMKHLTAIFQHDDCAPYFPADAWLHLSHFLEWSPELGLEHGFFEYLHKRILHCLPRYYDMAMLCYALLLRCAEGQRRFDDVDGIKFLHSIFRGKTLQNYEFIVLALMNGLHSKRALWRAREFTDLPDMLVNLARTASNNSRLQLYCLRALRDICVMSCIRRYTQRKFLKTLQLLPCLCGDSECARDDLVDWLSRDINDTSD